MVLVGVPLLMLVLGPLLRPLQARSARERQMRSDLSNTGTDIVGGLRVLRGIGGEQVFLARYRRESQATRTAAVNVAKLQSVLDALQVFLPGTFVVLVVWLGARSAVAGEISAGELVAFYGYAAFLMLPLRTATEFANKLIRGLVSSRRICKVLALEPDLVDPVSPADAPAPGSELYDARTGLRVRPGLLTAIVCERPDDSALLADRLGLAAAEPDDDVTWGGTPAHLAAPGRRPRPHPGLRHRRGPLRRPARATGSTSAAAATSARAIHTASAEDILEALPEGLDSVVTERGRSFSGGQRQRLVLARALAADPEVLVLVEPTSAVDAHTEARIAARLRAHRAGRTTVVTTVSPLLLDAVDEVAFLVDGRVVAAGTHADLLATDPAYRTVVVRDVEVVS